MRPLLKTPLIKTLIKTHRKTPLIKIFKGPLKKIHKKILTLLKL